jgi:hypothetical protein
MATIQYLYLVASTYGSGPYNGGNYNGTDSASGGLSNTGIALGLIVGAAALILLVALAVRIMKRPARKRDDDSSDDTSANQ